MLAEYLYSESPELVGLTAKTWTSKSNICNTMWILVIHFMMCTSPNLKLVQYLYCTVFVYYQYHIIYSLRSIFMMLYTHPFKD